MNVLDVIKMNVKSYRFVTCFMEPGEDVLFFNFHENLYLNLPLAKELVTYRLKFTENKKHYVIQQFSNLPSFDYEAKDYMKQKEGGLKNVLGLALVTPYSTLSAISDIFDAKHKNLPIKFFETETEAVIWIKQLKEYHKITQQ